MGKLITIDCNYLYTQFAAAYLMIENGRALFIENNTARAVDILLKALADAGMSPAQVDYLIITHVHLDHAGGTSALLKQCPNAKVLAHPKAAKRIIDPSRLIESAKKVYGEAQFTSLYGNITPVDPARVRAMEDGESLAFGSRSLSFFYTKGHATHHFCVHDTGTNGVFTGDSFGLRYPALQKHGLFIFPSTSPIDFDPVEARVSIQKIVDTGADRAFLTHFGELGDIENARDQLLAHLDAHERLLDEATDIGLGGKDLTSFCEMKLKEYFADFFERRNWPLSPEASPESWKLLNLDLELNAAGIAYVAQKRRETA